MTRHELDLKIKEIDDRIRDENQKVFSISKKIYELELEREKILLEYFDDYVNLYCVAENIHNSHLDVYTPLILIRLRAQNMYGFDYDLEIYEDYNYCRIYYKIRNRKLKVEIQRP